MATEYEFGIDLVDDEPIDARDVRGTWDDLEQLLSIIESTVSGGKPRVHWLVGGPAKLTVAAVPNGVSSSTIEQVIQVARQGFEHAVVDDSTVDWPQGLHAEARASIERILNRLRQIETVIVRATGYQPLTIDAASFNVVVRGKKRHRMRSSVEGVLLTLSHVAGNYRLGISERISGKYVNCSFDDALLAKAIDLFDQRVVVEGLVAYDQEGFPVSVSEVTDIYPRVTGLSFRDFRGVAPELLEGISVDDHIEEIRGQVTNEKLVYCDTPVFISYLTGDPPERLPVLDEFFEMHARGLVRIVISTLVIAETRRIRKSGSPGPAPGTDESNVDCLVYDAEKQMYVSQLFQSDLLEYLPLTSRIASLAAEIGNDIPSLLPPDCVHIATAITAEADMLFTWDGAGQRRRRPGEMLRYDGKIGDPPLKIVEPYPPYDHPLFE